MKLTTLLFFVAVLIAIFAFTTAADGLMEGMTEDMDTEAMDISEDEKANALNMHHVEQQEDEDIDEGELFDHLEAEQEEDVEAIEERANELEESNGSEEIEQDYGDDDFDEDDY